VGPLISARSNNSVVNGNRYACSANINAPAIGAAMFRVHRADMRQQRTIAQVPAMRDLPAPCPVLMKAGRAHLEHPALHANRPDLPMTLDEGILHF